MASKKSSAVPNKPTTATLAPSDSRYFGRNFFHSSSPSPTRNTAPEAAATLRSIPRESVMRSSMLAPGLLFPASLRSICGSSAESPVRLFALHDLPKQHERRIPRQIVFLQNRLEGTFLAMMPQLYRGNVKWRSSQLLRLAHHLLRRHKMKFRRRVHKLSNQPGARHSIDLYMLTRDPLHSSPPYSSSIVTITKFYFLI